MSENCENGSGTAPPTSANAIKLSLKGLGHVPSFKNSKMLSRGNLITAPKKQKWMQRAIRNIESQLRYAFRTRGIEITTGPSALCSIASLVPLDDSRKWIPTHSVSTLLVSKGEEGADIVIEPL